MSKLGTSPINNKSYFFSSPEKEKEFNEAPEDVKKMAMSLLDITVRKSMRDIQLDFIIKKFDELEERLEKLEKKI